MGRYSHIAVAAMLGVTSALSDDITTLDGKKYSDVTVMRVEADGILVKHAAGIGKLCFPELPQEIRDRYGYDSEKHRRYYYAQQQQAAKARLYRLLDSAAIEVEARLSRVLDDGALAYITVYKTYTFTNVVTKTHSGRSTTYNPLSDTLQTMPSGSQGSVVRAEVKTFTIKEKRHNPVFIVGLPSGYVDGDIWTGRLYPIGTYIYTSIYSDPKKIRKYAASPEVAIQSLAE
ncbi:MAG: hypothetical protein NZ740_10205 [Kiritimatiellae bacterium]|nr:hypothetical protein [Kiritimatiellia bacterium]MDW8459460.1 hypothetical protein [Verrucomicrobiota bacterium]